MGADNDKLFTQQLCRILGDASCAVVRTADQAPNMNAFAERFVQTVKRECLRKMILFGDRHLRKVLREFAEHYHQDRPHQGIGNELILPRGDQPPSGDTVIADERLGGLLRSYRRAA
ncbi:MAG: integrase core domain-containing protein [Polyangiales bacterium]